MGSKQLNSALSNPSIKTDDDLVKLQNENWYKNSIRDGNLLYINKNKSQDLMRISGNQSPHQTSNLALSDNNIPNEQYLVKLQNENPGLYQKEKAPKGNIEIAGEKSLVNLFETADESTFVHEMGHLFLKDLKMLAEMENATEQLKADWKTVQKWLGWKNEQKALTVAQHEKFARGFEAYLKTGAAPSSSLKLAFRAFKRWMNSLYKTSQSWAVNPPPKSRKSWAE